MFGFLKDKLKKVISDISEKIKKKPEEELEEKEEILPEEIKEEKKAKKQKEKKKKKEEREEKTPEQEEETRPEKPEEELSEEEEPEEPAEELQKEEIEEIEKDIEDISGKKSEKEIGEPETLTPKKGFFARLKEKLTEKLQVKLSNDDFNEFFSELEMTLIENSVAMEVIDALKNKLKKELVNKPIPKKEFENIIKKALGSAVSSLMIEPFDLIERIKKADKPYVIVFFGINGSGKTTTIAKFAHLLQKEKVSCVLAASDTFRAASIEQIEKHADKLGIKLIKHKYGADPAAVAFDAIAHAKASGIDVVLIDTAGRMHTQANLMKEMEKIVRVAKPNLKIFIGESIVGNDAVEQARAFNSAIGIDAIILSKADVDEKGGAMISVSYVTEKPILYLGTGQNYDNLEKFNKHRIIEGLGLE